MQTTITRATYSDAIRAAATIAMQHRMPASIYYRGTPEGGQAIIAPLGTAPEGFRPEDAHFYTWATTGADDIYGPGAMTSCHAHADYIRRDRARAKKFASRITTSAALNPTPAIATVKHDAPQGWRIEVRAV